MSAPHITVIAPVCGPPRVVEAFLDGLAALETRDMRVDYLFIDDNEDARSSELLAGWARDRPAVLLQAPPKPEPYVCDEATHHWTSTLVERVAAHKDRAIERALQGSGDAVFFVDADLVLDPLTLVVLASADVDIVAEVFWTYTQGDDLDVPNVWASDIYSMTPARTMGAGVDEEQQAARRFLARLLVPGLHAVGGLGACTLVRRRVLEAGVRFAALPNLSWRGEDRHFCLRATAHGFALWADTHVAPIHLYRSSDLAALDGASATFAASRRRWAQLERLRAHAAEGCASLGDAIVDRLPAADRAALCEILGRRSAAALTIRSNAVRAVLVHADGGEEATVEVDLAIDDSWRAHIDVAVTVEADAAPARPRRAVPRRQKLTLTMVVRNEADRYLREVIERVLPAIDDAVVIDDGSADGTADLCFDLLRGVPHAIVRQVRAPGADKHALRRAQWRAVHARAPEWILNLDADELFEPGAELGLRELLDADEGLVAFRVFDMWDRDHYCDDELSCTHHRWWPFLFRTDPSIAALHLVRALQCPRWPLHVLCRPAFASELRIQHLRWASPADRGSKHALDPAPRLVRWGLRTPTHATEAHPS